MFGPKKTEVDALMKNAVLDDDISRLQSLSRCYSMLKSSEMDVEFIKPSILLLVWRIEASLKS